MILREYLINSVLHAFILFLSVTFIVFLDSMNLNFKFVVILLYFTFVGLNFLPKDIKLKFRAFSHIVIRGSHFIILFYKVIDIYSLFMQN